MVLVNPSSSWSGRSYLVSEGQQQMKSGRQGYLNCRVLFLQSSGFLLDSEGKGARYGFYVQEGYL